MGVPGYAKFKEACGDKAMVILKNFAAFGAAQKEPLTLDTLFTIENPKTSFFATNKQEIGKSSVEASKSAPDLSAILEESFNEASLVDVPGYAKFKEACGDKAMLILKNFAAFGAAQKEPLTLDTLFMIENPETSFFAMNEQEIGESSVEDKTSL